MNMDEIEALIEAAKLTVERDMERRPPTSADGIWRFDRLLDAVFGERDKQFWKAVSQVAHQKDAGAGHRGWTPYNVIASYASTKAAFATPGFADARSKYMT